MFMLVSIFLNILTSFSLSPNHLVRLLRRKRSTRLVIWVVVMVAGETWEVAMVVVALLDTAGPWEAVVVVLMVAVAIWEAVVAMEVAAWVVVATEVVVEASFFLVYIDFSFLTLFCFYSRWWLLS